MAGVEVSKAELANIYGVSLPTISQWVNKGCPWITKGSPGKQWRFNTADVTTWREEHVAQQIQGDTSQLDIDEARRRKLAAEAAMMELDLAKRRGEVIEIEQVAAIEWDDDYDKRPRQAAFPADQAGAHAGWHRGHIGVQGAD